MDERGDTTKGPHVECIRELTSRFRLGKRPKRARRRQCIGEQLLSCGPTANGTRARSTRELSRKHNGAARTLSGW